MVIGHIGRFRQNTGDPFNRKKNSKLFFKISPDTNATEITSLDAQNVSNQETKLTNEMASERERRLFVSKGFQ